MSQQNVAGVFNLRPATTYHIRIVAENEIGKSEPSDTVTIITAEEAPSGPPSNVRVDALDQHTLKVRHTIDHFDKNYFVQLLNISYTKFYSFKTTRFPGSHHHVTTGTVRFSATTLAID